MASKVMQSGVDQDHRLIPGDRVKVKPYSEIVRTLDDRGMLDGCHFTEVMARHCSGTFRVRRNVELYFDEMKFRRLRCRDIVLLDEPPCDGSVHPDERGCDRACRNFWKTEWLQRISEDEADNFSVAPTSFTGSETRFRDHGNSNQCQLMTGGAGGREPLKWRLQRSLWILSNKVRTNGFRLVSMLLGRNRALANSFSRQCQPRKVDRSFSRNCSKTDERKIVAGKLWQSLRPGDLVRVKKKVEIDMILDDRGYHKGCYFMPSMSPHCGKQFRVLKRVSRFHDEAKGELINCRNLVALEGAYCDGSGTPETSGCDRMCFAFWRTEWLEPVENPAVNEGKSTL